MDMADSAPNEAKQETEINTIEIPRPRQKLLAMEFYEKVLGAPKYVVAPMVDQSELAWRLLCRQHGAQLCYSPMYHSNVFVQDVKYREQALQTCPEDRPLIIQFCGNDPKILLQAALYAQDQCDAIDLNLGCPQAIAKRGHYGSFLQEEWDLLRNIVSTLHANLSIPVTCKIRRFDDMEKTIKYAKMLVDAGCQMLTVHGRTRDQKGPLTGVADWSYIKAVRDSVNVPVLANGNILAIEDIDDCLRETNVCGVMTAEGNLHNPAIFERNITPLTWDLAHEYLDFVERYPCTRSIIRGHLFKLFHHILAMKPNAIVREEIAASRSNEQFRESIDKLKAKYEPIHLGQEIWAHEIGATDETANGDDIELDYNLKLPPWICQPYIRLEPEKHKAKCAEAQRLAAIPDRPKTEYFDADGKQITRKLMKKLRRRNRKPQTAAARERQRRCLVLCVCDNPTGARCDNKMCRTCCRDKCHTENVTCVGHRFKVEMVRRKNTTDTTVLTECSENTFDSMDAEDREIIENV